jgi:hypothetical protein
LPELLLTVTASRGAAEAKAEIGKEKTVDSECPAGTGTGCADLEAEVFDSLLIFLTGGYFGTNGIKRGANRDTFFKKCNHLVCKV